MLGMPMGAVGGTAGLGGMLGVPNPPAAGVVGMELTGRAWGTAPAAASRA